MTGQNYMSAAVKLFERGQLRAFVDITFTLPCGEMTISGFRVIQNGTKAPWVANPSISYQKDGKTVNKSIVETTRAMQPVLMQLVLDAYRAALSAT